MVFRRPNAPRNRPAPSHAAGGPVVVPAVVESAPEDSDADAAGFDPKKVADDLLGQLDDLLRSDSSIDAGDREVFTEHFAAALRDVVDSGRYAETDAGTALQDSVDQLKQYAEDGGDNDLIRQLNHALAPLEQRKTQIAFEFSRRLQADGQESALAWFREQQQADEQQSATIDHPLPESNLLGASRDEVTRSRSRRLRGPPARK